MTTNTRKTSSKRTQQKSASNETPPTQNDLYARVTGKIIIDLEQRNLTWRKPWHSDHLAGQVMRPLRWNGIPYQGINTLLLWGTAAEHGYTSPYWMTYKQAVELKANVCKGEKATQIIYADKITVEDKNDNNETVTSQIPFLKPYAVFNADQIDGLSDRYYNQTKQEIVDTMSRNRQLETFFAETKADIYTGCEASYSITTDRVQMPPFESFASVEDYYAILAHEITHWTRHPTRLDRDLGRKVYGDAGYAKEELVSELGACFLAADLGFEPMPEAKHAAYIQSWLHALQNDKRLIFSAASHAQKAVEYLHGLQPS
ncbi:ArdC family protein [Spirosoma lituiforme]